MTIFLPVSFFVIARSLDHNYEINKSIQRTKNFPLTVSFDQIRHKNYLKITVRLVIKLILRLIIKLKSSTIENSENLRLFDEYLIE